MASRYWFAIIAALVAAPAWASGTAAGTHIDNTALVSYVVGSTALSVAASNSFVVDQLVDDSLTWQDTGAVVAVAGAINKSLLFRLTNTGNGTDSFTLGIVALAGSGKDFTASDCQVYFDSDGDGIYSAGDTLYAPGSNDPSLAAGASQNILAVCKLPPDAPDQGTAQVKLTAESNTLTGEPGDAEKGVGVGGVTAVVGMTGGQATADGSYIASNVAYTIGITQTLTNPPGASQPTSGTIILYTITVTPSGGAVGRNLVVHDAIPEYTTYLPESITLNGAPLTDAPDSDHGDYDVTNPGAITVSLGDMAGTAKPPVITFKVRIN